MFGVLKLGKLGASMKKAGFNPRALFAASEPGAWYDPSDMSTLFQDAAGTVPVTAVEQPVGRILDKSGRGNHATQATTTKRPTLKQDANGCYYLRFDGVDDALQAGSGNFASTNKVTVWAGVNPASVSTRSAILSMPDTGFQSVNLAFGYPVVSTISWFPAGATSIKLNNQSAEVGGAYVVAGSADTATSSSLRVNGVTTSITTDGGGGNWRAGNLTVGADTTGRYFNGRLYALIVRGAQTPLSQIEATELYIKQKMRMP